MYRKPYFILLIFTLFISCIFILVQFPYAFYSPDISYHSSKILRATNGDYFIDPFSGTYSIYPAFFHTVFGLINRLIQLNPFQTVLFISLINIIGLYLSFFFFAKNVLEDIELTSIVTLFFSLIFYAPTDKAILLQNPFNFSLIFLLFSFGFLFRYLKKQNPRDLSLGFILGGIAINIWWFHIISFSSFTLFNVLYLLKHKLFRVNILFCFILFMLTFSFTFWHFYTIRSVLPSYFSSQSLDFGVQSSKPKDLAVIMEWLLTFFTKGNSSLQLFHLPYSLHTLEDFKLLDFSLKNIKQFYYPVVAFVHYHLLIIPFNIILVITSIIFYYKNHTKNITEKYNNVLFHSGMLIFILSLFISFIGTFGHLRRVQFITYILFLIFSLKMLTKYYSSIKSKIFLHVFVIFGILSLFFTVINVPRLYTNKVPQETEEVIDFIKSLPNYRNNRIFALEDSLRSLTPFVEFKSFVGNRHGGYYSQDYISSKKLYESYNSIKNKNSDWYITLKSNKVSYLIFRPYTDDLEKELTNYYKRKGRIVLENSKWLIVQIL